MHARSAPPEVRPSPRWRALFFACVALASLIAACRDDSDEESGAAEDVIAFTFGDFSASVPDDPERVVVLEGRGDLDAALTLGYHIVATGNGFDPSVMPGSQGGPFEGLVPEDVELLEIGADYRPNYEQLAALRPDLIIMRANAWRGDFFGNDRVREIAPVLAIETNRSATWRQDLQEQARILGREGDVASLLEEHDQQVSAAKAEIADRIAGKKFAVIVAGGAGPVMFVKEISMYTGTELGMDLPYLESTEFGESGAVSPERLGEYLGDIDVIFRQVNDDASTAALDAIPTWKALPAVQAGRVHDLSSDLNNAGIHATRTLVEELVKGTEQLD